MTKGHTHYCGLVREPHVEKIPRNVIRNCQYYCGIFISYKLTLYKCGYGPQNKNSAGHGLETDDDDGGCSNRNYAQKQSTNLELYTS